MREELIQQYASIRETIRANIQTIGKLIEQADGLKQVVDKISEPEVKVSLEHEIKNIEETITLLIQQTDRLFDSYNAFVKKVFSNK